MRELHPKREIDWCSLTTDLWAQDCLMLTCHFITD